MSLAYQAALRVLRGSKLKPPVTESGIDKILNHFGIRIIVAPATLEVPEFVWGRYVGIRADQSRSSRIWLKAHALGHYLLHAGDQTSLPRFIVARQERQAEEFAGWLLLAWVPFHWEPWQVAEECDVPYECVYHWERLVTGESAWR